MPSHYNVENPDRSGRSPAPRLWLYGALVLAGMILHVQELGRLGLYWSDDTEFFLVGLQNAHGSVLSFILNDTALALPSDRPLSYFTWMLARAAFAVSLPALHALLVGLLILNACLVAAVAGRMVKSDWFMAASGLLYLTYPLSPLQAIWASTVHYITASILVCLTLLFFMRMLESSEDSRRTWRLAALGAYIGVVFTFESYALIPLGFMLWHTIRPASPDGEPGGWRRLGRFSLRGSAAVCLVQFAGVLALYGVWRLTILPYYGIFSYGNADLTFRPQTLAHKLAEAIETSVNPWDQTTGAPLLTETPLLQLLFVALFVLAGVLSFWLLGREAKSQDAGGRFDQRSWWTAAGISFICLSAALAVVAVSAGSIEYLNRFSSRVNYIALFGTVLLITALLRLMVQLSTDNFVVAGALFLLALMLVSEVDHVLIHGFSWLQESGRVLHQAFTLHLLVAAGYLQLAALAILRTLGGMGRRRSARESPLPMVAAAGHRARGLAFRTILSTLLAYFVATGALFHCRVKEAYAERSDEILRVYQELRVAAPTLQDGTFVVLMTPDRGKREGASYEVTNYLRVLYNNSTLSGNLYGKVYFTPDCALSKGWDWDDLVRIPYDRILFVHDDGETVSLPGRVSARLVGGGFIEVHSNLGRVLDAGPKPSPVWERIQD